VQEQSETVEFVSAVLGSTEEVWSAIFADAGGVYDLLLEPGDVEEGLSVAAAIGDDTLQRNAGRRVTPEAFTHGPSADRQ
jgi:hypothetical protein